MYHINDHNELSWTNISNNHNSGVTNMITPIRLDKLNSNISYA